ncbi:MAG: DNA-binding protein [Gammaproteobacteria bacterium]|jgi:chromosome segregation ATPase
MERHPPLSYDEVCEAANSLQRQGHHVTIDALHDLLARGSKTTIHKHRERWRREMQRATDEEEVASPSAPDPLKDFFKTTFSDLWQAALEAAHEALQELRDEADRAIANAQADVQRAHEEAESARRESAMLVARVTALADKFEDTMRELTDERQQRVTQEVKADAEARAAAERIGALEADLHKAHAREAELNAQMHVAVTELQDQLANTMQRQAEIEQRARSALDAMKREASQREQALQRALKLTQNRAQATLVAWHNKEKTWIEVRSKMEARLENELKESARLEKAFAQAQLSYKQLEERTHALDRERVGLQEAGVALRDQLSGAQRQLARVELQIHDLLRDNARLTERLSQRALKENPSKKA